MLFGQFRTLIDHSVQFANNDDGRARRRLYDKGLTPTAIKRYYRQFQGVRKHCKKPFPVAMESKSWLTLSISTYVVHIKLHLYYATGNLWSFVCYYRYLISLSNITGSKVILQAAYLLRLIFQVGKVPLQTAYCLCPIVQVHNVILQVAYYLCPILHTGKVLLQVAYYHCLILWSTMFAAHLAHLRQGSW